MAIEMVRIPSDTPNITNIDDIIGLRYAYGNQNGYVINKGNECSYTINGSIFKINSGRLVLQGVECDIDANGVEISIDSIASKQYFTVYLQVNLALNEITILSQSDTATYPIIEIGDDLTKNNIGTAKLELYHFDAINGIISNVQKVVNSIKYTKDVIVEKAINSTNSVYKQETNQILPMIINNQDHLIVDNKQILRRIEIFNEGRESNTRTINLQNKGLNAGDILEITIGYKLDNNYKLTIIGTYIIKLAEESEAIQYNYFLSSLNPLIISGGISIHPIEITTLDWADSVSFTSSPTGVVVTKHALDQSKADELKYYPYIYSINKII